MKNKYMDNAYEVRGHGLWVTKLFNTEDLDEMLEFRIQLRDVMGFEVSVSYPVDFWKMGIVEGLPTQEEN